MLSLLLAAFLGTLAFGGRSDAQKLIFNALFREGPAKPERVF